MNRAWTHFIEDILPAIGAIDRFVESMGLEVDAPCFKAELLESLVAWAQLG